MLTIETKFIPATNYRSSRVKAYHSSDHTKSITIEWAHELDTTHNHFRALKAYIKKYGLEYTKWNLGGNDRVYYWVALPSWGKPWDTEKLNGGQ